MGWGGVEVLQVGLQVHSLVCFFLLLALSNLISGQSGKRSRKGRGKVRVCHTICWCHCVGYKVGLILASTTGRA